MNIGMKKIQLYRGLRRPPWTRAASKISWFRPRRFWLRSCFPRIVEQRKAGGKSKEEGSRLHNFLDGSQVLRYLEAAKIASGESYSCFRKPVFFFSRWPISNIIY
jgi:hypothetical protein